MRNFYELIDYTAGTDPDNGIATIRVIGCNTNTQVSVPPGAVIDDPTWQHAIAQACADVLTAIDPGSRDYDSSLDNWANETPPWTPPGS